MQILIGNLPFTIRGVIEHEPGRRVGGFSLGPRVLVDYAALVGGRPARVRQPRALPGDAARSTSGASTRSMTASARRLQEHVRQRALVPATEDEIGEDLQRAENYLSLVGLVVVVLGGIGVSSVTRVFVEQKLKSIAVLKCVGAGTWQVLSRLPAAGDGARPGRQPHGPWRSAGSRWPPRLRSWARRGATLPLVTRAHAAARWCRASASACWSRCCSRSCRCCGCGTSSRRCCCASRRAAARRRDWLRAGVAVAGRRGARGARGLAGRLVARRRGGLRRLRRARARAAPGRAGAGAARRRRSRARGRSRCATRCCTEPPGQPDARRAARRRPRHVLHPRGPRRAGEPAARLRASTSATETPDMFLIDIQSDQVAGLAAFLARAHRPRRRACSRCCARASRRCAARR